jgi:hypothetical protein
MDLRAALLKVTADEPGNLLVLEGEKLTLPSVATGLLGGAALGIVGGLLEMSGQADSGTLWRPRQLRADREKGHLAIDDVQVIREEERSESITLEQVEALTVRTRHYPPTSPDKQPPFSADHPRSVEATVHLRAAGAARQRTLRLEVHGVDTCEKAADLAFRLGAAMGLLRQRVVSSDPRRIEVEMRREAAPGLEAMPPLEGRADYTRGLIAPGAARAAAEHRMPTPDPSRFPGRELRLVRWAPGDEVRLDKPMRGAAVGCLPFAIAGLVAGPVFWSLFHDAFATILATVLGLLFGGIALGMAAMSLPRHVRIAWGQQEVIVSGALRRRRIPLHRLSGLDLRCVRQWRTSGSRGQNVRRMYSCAVQAQVRGETTTDTTAVELMSTREFEDDPETPYDAALPLTRQLAEALGVEWRVIDYD